MKDKIEVITTGDGSSSLYNPQLDETYHSSNGAITESRHVFIQEGLDFMNSEQEEIYILEVGFGTGLNAILTLEKAEEIKSKINYVTLELYPLDRDLIDELNYKAYFPKPLQKKYEELHKSDWGKAVEITSSFTLTKLETSLGKFETEQLFDLVYFDAFGPKKQPEMWTMDFLAQATNPLKKGGALVTYCAMGQFRRDLKSLGLAVEKVPGPPGKREMTRGVKG